MRSTRFIVGDARENPVDIVGDASSAFGITKSFGSSVSVLLFFWVRRRRNKKNTTAAMMIRKASEPPTAPPMTAPEGLLELAAAMAVGVLLAGVDVLLAVENAVGSGTVDESRIFRSWK